MNRNKYIVALTEGLFVVESRERGGTFQAGLECLRQRKRLLVVEFADGADESRRGNRLLIERGGRAVRTPRQLKAILKEAAQETTLPCGQQLLAL
jgi:predicted Rossmann fold nucleotide-binding protein DprA/Smf involved in DNA uptake